MSIRSSRPEYLNPALVAEKENPLGTGTMSEAMRCPLREVRWGKHIRVFRGRPDPERGDAGGDLTPGPDTDQKAGMSKVMTMILAAVVCCAVAVTARGASLEDELFFAADAYYQGLDDRAEQGFLDVLKKDPDNEYALGRLGVVLAERGDLDGAAGRFAHVLAVSPDNLFALKWMGILALRRGDRDEAYRYFQAMLEADPENAQASAWLGIGLLLSGDAVGAVNQFAAASRADSVDPGLHFLLSVAYLGLGMPENARLELETTLELRPTDVQALTLLGTLFSRTGQRELAVAAWRQALAVEPGHAQARFCLSRSLADEALAAQVAGRGTDAARLWLLALEADPGNAEALAAVQGAAAAARSPRPEPGGQAAETAVPGGK
ncbi:tetratricopeptide repeat protein [Desulfolutivibrio sulfoxidireducens]|nr:tetratricopeptide repeat protein [Desulfolutivibrio sulfoxidireducens]